MFVFFSRVQLQQEKSSSLLVLYHFVDSLNADPIMMIRRLTAQVSYGFCFWALILDTRLVILWCFWQVFILFALVLVCSTSWLLFTGISYCLLLHVTCQSLWMIILPFICWCLWLALTVFFSWCSMWAILLPWPVTLYVWLKNSLVGWKKYLQSLQEEWSLYWILLTGFLWVDEDFYTFIRIHSQN